MSERRRDPAVEAIADALDRGLSRATDALERAGRRHAEIFEQWAKRTNEPWLADLARGDASQVWARRREEHLTRHEQRKLAREEAKLQRKLVKQQARIARQQAKLQGKTIGEGIVYLALSAVMAATALIDHNLWWMVFPAMGPATQGARILSTKLVRAPGSPERADEDVRPSEPVRQAEPADPRTARVNTVCDKILAELKTSPASVRELVGKPEKTIEGLRQTCLSLSQRERELRKLLDPRDEERLRQERQSLASRIASEADAVVRGRLEGALAALDAQLQQRGELATAAARFEAEHTRIAYTLESLYTQILRLRSADSAGQDPASAQLRQSLSQLSEEIVAVAEAMESVNRAELTPIAPIGDAAGGREGVKERS